MTKLKVTLLAAAATRLGALAIAAFTVVPGDSRAANVTTLVTFNGGNDGAYPNGGLIADAVGNLFGMTRIGDVWGDGTVFEIVKTSSGYASSATTLVSHLQAKCLQGVSRFIGRVP